MLDQIRRFFSARDVLEVEVPVLADTSASDVHLDSLRLCNGQYLLTSPEPYMKRLLGSGAGAIFTLSKAFRANESGRRHNPEFLMLEWYRPGYALDELLEETLDLLLALSRHGRDQSDLPWPSKALLKTPIRFTYADLMIEACGLNPFTVSDDRLRACVRSLVRDYDDADTAERSILLDLLFSRLAEPLLTKCPVAVVEGYPAEQASQSRTRIDTQGRLVADRFELYLYGLEIANAYHELTDVEEFRRRHDSDNARRRVLGLSELALDEALVGAMRAMPPCSGIALGVDRLVMRLLGLSRIDQVLSFASAGA
ncbi:EF-P lysine aminoacylase EpmA [Allohahella marinimesophila]|uniref:EF-P lysine aminoacylase EpmA n=1 Tax=Allohahella marinimesophila TaxID=1054972 RepID=A0ABP7NIE0_9GAMM